MLALLDLPVDDPQWQALEPPQRRQHILEACTRLLLRASQDQPILLIVENLHWIDTETQAFLDHLVDSLPAARLVLLVTYRPDYPHGWGSKTYYTQLRLDPLPPASAEALLHEILGNDPTLASLIQLLIARTAGNPFFLEESVRTLVETGSLVGVRGAYSLAQALPTLQVPATVQAVLAARMDRLPPEAKSSLADRRSDWHRGPACRAARYRRTARDAPYTPASGTSRPLSSCMPPTSSRSTPIPSSMR